MIRLLSFIGRWPFSIRRFGLRPRLVLWPVAVIAVSTISVSAVRSQESCQPIAPALSTDQVERWLASVGVFVSAKGGIEAEITSDGGTFLQLLVSVSAAPEGIEMLDTLAIEASFPSFCDWLGVTYAVLEAHESVAQPEEARGMMMVDERIEQNMMLIEEYESEVRREVNRIAADAS